MPGDKSTTQCQEFGSLLAVEHEVAGQTTFGFLNVGACLVQREGEAIHGLHDCSCGGLICLRDVVKWSILRNDPRSPKQKEHAIFEFQFVYLDFPGKPAHSLCTSGQQNVAAIAFREIVTNHSQRVDIIEGEQPSAVRFKPAFDSVDDEALILSIFLRQV